ncbi:MAG TPA: helix-hairpin-helix domain-containing protein [Puia sp.]|nr:helix-hairpin-helix domain-containing protein [Puia sp.]
MSIDNDYIAGQFSLLGKLMDIHGENSFKTKSYSVAAFTLEKLPTPVQDIPPDKITSIRGFGDAIAKKIREILETGELSLLQQYIANTPPGILEMLQIKGLGPKKIATIWKEMEIESVGELLYACQENRLLLYKGFGEKTQFNVREAIEFRLRHIGSHLYADIDTYALQLESALKAAFPTEQVALTGEFRRQLEVITKLEFVSTAAPAANAAWLAANPCEEGVAIEFIHCQPADFTRTLFQSSCSGEFFEAFRERAGMIAQPTSEEEIFAAGHFPFLPPFLREQRVVLDRPVPSVIQPGDIRGVIHSHSKWSDGSYTLEEMANACIQKGFEYLVISDHSKSAFYANGLKEERIREQHAQIEDLNRRLTPFRIFKSIESDILNDGALDYSNDVLATFDLVIASVHSNLKMTGEKAMSRLIRAIENPYTTIIGHLTGRLLLSRPGYPVDHKKIIDACVANQVAIELNAHPRRLDMDWRWIGYALDRGAFISIDPDAHYISGFDDIRYGVLAGRKAGLTKERNLSSFSLDEFERYLADRKKSRGI